MKKIVLFTYYFPPSNQTAANRISSWAKDAVQNGYYPIVITRDWSNGDKSEYKPSHHNKIITSAYYGGEIHYVPYKGNIRTKIFSKFGKKYALLRKILTLIELFLGNKFYSVTPYKNLFDFGFSYLSTNKVDAIIVTGGPFQLLNFGYLAFKKFSIPWFVDYRDGWTCGNLITYSQSTFIEKILNIHNSKFEKKWVSTSSCFFSVSNHLVNLISNKTKKEGKVIYNGFSSYFKQKVDKIEKNYTSILFLYSGELYILQKYRNLISVFKRLIDKYNNQIHIKLVFQGTTASNYKPRNLFISDYKENFFFY